MPIDFTPDFGFEEDGGQQAPSSIQQEEPGLLDFLMGAPRKGMPQSPVSEIARKGVGAAETAANVASGFASYVPAVVGAANAGAGQLGQILTGGNPANTRGPGQAFEEISNELTYQPRTPVGQAGADIASEINNRYLVPLMGHVGSFPSVPERGGKLPKVETRLSELDKLTQEKIKPEQKPIYVGRDGIAFQEDLPTRIRETPEAVETAMLERQRGLEEQAKQAELPPGEQLDLFKRAEEGEQVPMNFEFNKEARPQAEPIVPPDETKAQLTEAVSKGLMTSEQAKAILDKVAELEDKGITVPKNQRGIFGGIFGEDPGPRGPKLDNAIKLERMGHDADSIWQKTGWTKGGDGKWRYEIDDSKVTVRPKVLRELTTPGSVARLSELIDHPKLFKAYPQLRFLRVEFNPNAVAKGAKAHFDAKNWKVVFGEPIGHLGNLETPGRRKALIDKVLANFERQQKEDGYKGYTKEQLDSIKADMRDVPEDYADSKHLYEKNKRTVDQDFTETLIHEIQHAVQHVEDFQKGYNWRDADGSLNQLEWGRTHGEIEAEAAAGRLRWDKNDRAYSDPLSEAKENNVLLGPESMVYQGKVVPRGQRGGIDIKAIGDAAKEFADKLHTPITNLVKKVAPPKDSTEVLAANRLFKKELENYIPADPKPETIIKEALTQEDSGLKYNSLQSGGTLTGIKTGSTLIQGSARLFQNASKRSELTIRNYVQPVEKQLKKFSHKEIIELSEVLKRESLHDIAFSADELKKIGYSDKQLAAIDAFRVEQDRAFHAQNDALVAQGRDPLTKRDHYLSSRWQGSWHVPVYENGKLVWYIAEHSKKEAERALQYLKDSGVKADASSKVVYKGNRGRTAGDVQDAYRTMLGILDEHDPRVATVKEIAEEGMVKGAQNVLAQNKHFENKANIRGFIGDRPWKDPKTDAFEMMQQQFQYMKNAHTWAETQKAVDATKQILSNPELMEKQPNNMRYAQEYSKNQLGFGENAALASLEANIAEVLGRDRATFYNAVGSLKSLFLATKLGFFNTGYLIANLVQPLWTASWQADMTAKGFNHSPVSTFIRGNLDGLAGFLTHNADKMGLKIPFKMTELGKEGFKYAEANGIISRDIFDEAGGLGENKITETVKKVSGLTIAQVEHISRYSTFMSFAHHLEQSGMFKGNREALFQKAEEFTNASMVDYRRGERPMLFEKAGAVGSAASALQTFKFNYYNQLHYFMKEAGKGNAKPLATFLAVQAAIGGMISMPFLQELDDVLDTLKGMVPDAVYDSIKNFGIKKHMAEGMGTWAYGGMSKVTGAKLDSRFDSGNIQDWSLDSLFPIFSDLVKQGQAITTAAASPSSATMAKAAYAVTPPGALQGNVETSMDAFKAGKMPDGRQIYLNARNPEKQQADFARTKEQENYKRLGLTELNEGAYKEQRFRQNKDETELQKRMQAQIQHFENAVVDKDISNIQLYAKRYINFGGTPDNLNTILDNLATKRNIPRETIEAIKANTLGSVLKVKRMKEATDAFKQ